MRSGESAKDEHRLRVRLEYPPLWVATDRPPAKPLSFPEGFIGDVRP
jgi:hypothetical protein